MDWVSPLSYQTPKQLPQPAAAPPAWGTGGWKQAAPPPEQVRCTVVDAKSQGVDETDLGKLPPLEKLEYMKIMYGKGFKMACVKSLVREHPPPQGHLRRWQTRRLGKVLDRTFYDEQEVFKLAVANPPVMGVKRRPAGDSIISKMDGTSGSARMTSALCQG